MALREGLPSKMLYADEASTMRNFIIVVAWNGGSPKVSSSCTEPKGSTFSLENPSKWAFTGSSFSLLMPILLNTDAKMMATELPVVDQDLMNSFISHDGPYYQRVILGMLVAFHVRVREGYGGIQSRELGHSLYLQCLP